MVTSLYLIMACGLIIWLSLKVIGFRHEYRVSIGHGDHPALQNAISAQHNAIEYLPIGLLMLLVLELAGMPWWCLHPPGIALLLGRVIHARAMLNDDLKMRVRGMQVTIYTLIALMLLNVLALPYVRPLMPF